MSELSDRVASLELAVLAIATQRFEDVGHPFHGNQYTGGNDDADLGPPGRPIWPGGPTGQRIKDEAAQMSRAARGPAADHAIKAPREHLIVDAARERGLIPPKGSVAQLTTGYGTSSENAAAVLPVGEKINLLGPATPGSIHEDQQGFAKIVVQSAETGHLRALGTAGDIGTASAFGNIGQQVHLQHDQTGGKIGGYGGHEVVGILHPDGTAEGVIPDRKIAYSVFK